MNRNSTGRVALEPDGGVRPRCKKTTGVGSFQASQATKGNPHPCQPEYHPPSASARIDELFSSDRELGDVLEDVARLGVRLLMQTALEAEVTEFFGRDRYARGDGPDRAAATATARRRSRRRPAR